ncbi:hypothetical protein M8J76_010812 [Diaphorina citri]|nr:hypothetical protein M8J76_010812 [Diaphorina citri]
MTSREVKKDKMGDDPPYLAVGTDVSAKYKGAFCEAKVRKVVRVVKCKVLLKNGGNAFVTDDQIKGSLRIGTSVEVKLPDKKDFVEASISSIKDLSQYTVALCLKSGRHFAESETLDQLPLTHPEHFSTPVIGASRRGRRRLGGNDDSSDEEESTGGAGERQREADIGKVVCVEMSEKKKQKDNWFPGLIVAPNAQDAVRIDVDEDYLVRSFKDGRYFTVPKKEATEFTREIGLKVDNPSLKLAVEKALLFLDKDELPPHWDRDLLFGLVDTDLEDDSDQLDSDSSDDEPREEKDHFVAQLYKFMDDRGTPINKGPVIQSKDVDLYRLFRVVHKLGGYNRVTNQNQWKLVTHKMNFGQSMSTVNNVKHAYKKFLHSFEDFYRKLGCTMVNHPRGNRRSNKSNRSLIRDKDRATPVQKESDRIKLEPTGPSSASTELNRSECPTEVKVEVKKEDEELTPKREKTKEFEAKRDRQVKEDALRREKTRDKAARDKEKDNSKESKDKVESIIPLAKKKIEETYGKLKVEDKPKTSIGILAKFSYKKEKPGVRGGEEKERLNRVKKSLGKGSSSGLMERQKRTIKETVKAFAKSLGFGGKSGGGSTTGTRKMSASTTSGSGEDEEKKKKEDGALASTEKKRASSGSRREDLLVTTPPPPPSRKSSCSGGEEKSGGGRSNSRNKTRKPEDEGSTELGGTSATSPGENSDSGLEIVSPHKCISVGDKLKVYYGPNHKSKVTYEAKVLSTREEDGKEREYLVHYTGWNTRYDEWIRRNRIAENLSWTPARSSKRIGKPEAQQTPSSSQRSSETSSPGISKGRTTPRRSSARTSIRTARPNTDDSESDKESGEGSESETETETNSILNRSMRSRRVLSDEDKKPSVSSTLPSPSSKTRAGRKCKTDEDEEEEEGEDEKKGKEEEDDKKKLPSHEAERKSLRLSQRKKQEADLEKRLGPDSDSGSESETQEDPMKAKVLEIIEPLDDVYEFKEPEPFNFKQKKTISPPSGTTGVKAKKNIGLFEDYDHMEEDTDDPISAAIQRVMDTCNENQVEDMDLLDPNSSDSDLSNDSSNMCEMMQKRLQSEINTYEGPKSRLKAGGRGREESPTPMRTRRSSESKSVKSDDKASPKPSGRTKVDKSEVPEKTGETVKSEGESNVSSRIKKIEDNIPKTKRSETESMTSPRIKRDNESLGKVKKLDTETISTTKIKKTEADKETTTPESPNSKVKQKSDTLALESSMKTRLKSETRCSSPGSKTRSKTELALRGEEDSSAETNTLDMKQPESPLDSKLKTTDKVKTLLNVKKTTSEMEAMKKQTPTKSSESTKPIPNKSGDSTKVQPMANKSPENTKPQVTEPQPPQLSNSSVSSVDKSTKSMASEVKGSLSKILPMECGDKTKKHDPMGLKLQTKSKAKTPGSPTPNVSVTDIVKSKPQQKTHTDFSIQTEPHELDKDENYKSASASPSLLPKVHKLESSTSVKAMTTTETKSTDIPVLQRIETVLPKTPIKREAIDPSKIDLIKISPNMPQLEKIDAIDLEKVDTTVAVTPAKREDKETREDMKFPLFKFEDVMETPEKVFHAAVDQDTTIPPPSQVRTDKKIEFKMKPKAPSPPGFGKTERVRKLIRLRMGESPSKEKPLPKEKKSPQLAQVKKYLGPASKPDTKGPSNSETSDTKPNAETKMKVEENKDSSTPTVLTSSKDTVPEPSKNKDTTPTLSTKTKQSPVIISSKTKDNAPTSSSKIKESSPVISTKPKDSSPISTKTKETSPMSIKTKESALIISSKTKDNVPNIPIKMKDTSILSSKSKESILSPSSKSKDSTLISSTKNRDSFPAVPSSKSKETPTTSNKIKETSPTSKNKDSPVISSKNKDVTSIASSKIKEISSVLVKSKDSPSNTSSKLDPPSNVTKDIAKPSLSTTTSAETSKQTVQETKKLAVREDKSNLEPLVKKDDEKEEKLKEEPKKNKEELTTPSETATKRDSVTPSKRNLDEHVAKDEDQCKKPDDTPKIKEEVGKESDLDEEALKKGEKSKELASVFEFDESLEDEMVDIESDSYLIATKRKLENLMESPSSEFISNKMQKLNELEKLKQKLFMDCSGESEDLEEKVEESEKAAKEGEEDKEVSGVIQKEGEKQEESSQCLETEETLEEEVDNTLLCKETIPGSPTPYQDELNLIMELPPTTSSSCSNSSSTGSTTANAVLDNTPPTTPESSLSPPRNECSTPYEAGSTGGMYAKMMTGDTESPKKMSGMKRRSSQTERNLKKRLKQSPRNTGAGSDSDDLSLSETFSIFSPSTTDITKSKYSYFVELDPELDQAQRIAVVQQKLQDLRKEYMMYKQELVTIDRRRKKIRRRERENKKNSERISPPSISTANQ